MRRLLIVLAVLALALVVADRVAAHVAAGLVADAVRRDQGLATAPDVDIQGFPFLTQAVGGVYREIDVRLSDVPAQQGVRVDAVAVRLRGVHLAPGDAARGAVSRLPVDDADAGARVSFSTLTSALTSQLQAAGATGPLTVAPGSSPGEVSVTANVPVGGAPVPVQARVRLAVAGGALTASAVPSSLAAIPAAQRTQAARLLSRASVRLPPLPFGFEARSVAVGPDGVSVGAAGHALVLK